MKLIDIRSPNYVQDYANWLVWRDAVEAGPNYVRANLQRLPSESIPDYTKRMAVTPVPAFIKATIREITTGIYSQMELTARTGGPQSLQDAIMGGLRGVDGAGTAMNYFMIMQVLRELLIMKRVGIFVDRPPLSILPTVREALALPPYMYLFTAEQILAWHVRPGAISPEEILLQRDAPVYAEGTHMTVDTTSQYVYMRKVGPSEVACDIFDQNGDPESSHRLNLPMVPFVLLEISESVIQDVIGHQNALLNLGSSNVAFAMADRKSVV